MYMQYSPFQLNFRTGSCLITREEKNQQWQSSKGVLMGIAYLIAEKINQTGKNGITQK